jgi:hypothetical protein
MNNIAPRMMYFLFAGSGTEDDEIRAALGGRALTISPAQFRWPRLTSQGGTEGPRPNALIAPQFVKAVPEY